jgi:digeranylgeranylglycerophospholipid reductase
LDYDVVVVGAGPAGAVSATYAAKAGAKTVIVDRKREVGNPVRCAEVVAGNLPSDFGMKNSSVWLDSEAHFFKLVSPLGNEVRVDTSPYVGYVLNRSDFEKELVSMAVDKGSDVILGKTVTKLEKDGISMGNEKIKAKIIVAADGVDSRIGRQAGIIKKAKDGMLGSCAQHTLVGIDVDCDVLAFYLGGKYAPGGYAWVFPKSSSEANVGVGILKNQNLNANKVLDNFIKDIFPNGKSIRFVAGCVPSALPPESCVKGNVILVGDSARQVNPFTGAGIANSFVAGKIAGELCGEIAVKNQPISRLMDYEGLWRARMQKKIERSFKLRNKVLLDDKKIERFVKNLNLIPKFVLRRLLNRLHY